MQVSLGKYNNKNATQLKFLRLCGIFVSATKYQNNL